MAKRHLTSRINDTTFPILFVSRFSFERISPSVSQENDTLTSSLLVFLLLTDVDRLWRVYHVVGVSRQISSQVSHPSDRLESLHLEQYDLYTFEPLINQSGNLVVAAWYPFSIGDIVTYSLVFNYQVLSSCVAGIFILVSTQRPYKLPKAKIKITIQTILTPHIQNCDNFIRKICFRILERKVKIRPLWSK